VVCHQDNKSKSFCPPAAERIEDELDTLCAQLNIFLGTLKAEAAGVPAKWEVPEPIAFRLDSLPQHIVEPPTNSRWHYQTEFNGVGFQKQGEDTIGDIIGSLFWAVFVNGIVGVFVLEIFSVLNPERKLVETWWYGMLAMSPFIAYGLFRIGVAWYYFLELFRVTTWTFAYGEADFCSVRFGSRRTAQHHLTGWTSLIVRLPEDEQVTPELIAEGNPDAIRDFYDACDRWQLAFLNAAGEQLLAIEKLSKPEALWMADVVLREQRAVR
jgi:hypothetical protein